MLSQFQRLLIILIGILFVSLCMSIVKNYRASVNSNVLCFPDNAALPSVNEAAFLICSLLSLDRAGSERYKTSQRLQRYFYFLDNTNFEHRTRNFGLS